MILETPAPRFGRSPGTQAGEPYSNPARRPGKQGRIWISWG